ncbi:MAG: hypothetical protein J6Q18_02015 [Oscillospiraceae bacterium]|nr:hypothetical protein [Oscillospiraceae bacterium]
MSFGFVFLLPIVFWLFIVMLIIRTSKPRRRPHARSNRGRVRQPARSFSRPQMQKGLFDMDLNRKTEKKQKKADGGMFRNAGYDDYSVLGRKKDFVSGYDKRLKQDGYRQRRATHMQYSHTYDGHEPWDKCLPKEKDPWDKDFYA